MRRGLAAAVCLLAAATLQMRAQTPGLNLSIVVRGLTPVPIVRSALAEAARVWAPYDVRVLLDADANSLPAGDDLIPLIVTIDEDAPIDEGENGLGSVRFAANGVPESMVSIHLNPVRRLVMASATTPDLRSAPSGLSDELVARALGRTLAHEIGHFVLRWTHHASRGLMRGDYHSSALIAADVKAFTLTDVELARLHIVLASQPRLARTRTEPPLAPVAAPEIAAARPQ